MRGQSLSLDRKGSTYAVIAQRAPVATIKRASDRYQIYNCCPNDRLRRCLLSAPSPIHFRSEVRRELKESLIESTDSAGAARFDHTQILDQSQPSVFTRVISETENY